MSFRHPLRPETNGAPGRKVRKGLGTTDDAEADRLIEEMNKLLSEPSWWSASKRNEAERAFSAIVTAAFYDGIQAGIPDSWSIREDHIRIPRPEEGYARVLLVGTTGAGKTSLLRHLIGSDPERDRFLSTSTARTTISDIEVILAPGAYSAVITFFSEFWVRANLEECILDACSTWRDTASMSKAAERFLTHRDQRFRLGYALGRWREDARASQEDAWSFGASPPPARARVEKPRTPEDEASEALVKSYLDGIVSMSERNGALIKGKENKTGQGGPGDEALQERFEELIREDDHFDRIIEDIFKNFKTKFAKHTEGKFEYFPSGWPQKWLYETDDRSAFIETLRPFFSNSANRFGSLLTPFVDGMRLHGPLYPDFVSERPKLAIFDGQGLGHTPDSAASVTTQITKRFDEVDVILLVDSAQQPIQASSLSVIRSLAIGGHARKLAIAFTHFDQMEGINLPTFELKRAHLMTSVMNGLASLKDAVGSSIIKSIEREIEERCFILGALDKSGRALPAGVVGQFESMLAFFGRSIEPAGKLAASPKYNPDGLLLALQGAAKGFRRTWSARLGLEPRASTQKEHWTRVRALNKRIAGELGIEYDTLKPVADFIARLGEEISRFLDHPRWLPPAPSEEEAEAVIATIRRQVYSDLHGLAERRLLSEHLGDWRQAYRHAGEGSALRRARQIDAIYGIGAPIVSTLLTEETEEFVREIRSIVYRAIKENGGQLEPMF
ncbi:energy-coupling factor transporter ATP-binding protein EcfA2 [Bradyrhizobium sp. i1.3.6]